MLALQRTTPAAKPSCIGHVSVLSTPSQLAKLVSEHPRVIIKWTLPGCAPCVATRHVFAAQCAEHKIAGVELNAGNKGLAELWDTHKKRHHSDRVPAFVFLLNQREQTSLFYGGSNAETLKARVAAFCAPPEK